MQRTVLKGKIHRATVTQANRNYEGSVTISENLIDAAGIIKHVQANFWDVTNGARLTTYAIRGGQGSEVICINGAGAHRVQKGDIVIIAAFVQVTEDEANAWQPSVVFVDSHNRTRAIGKKEQTQSDMPPR